MIGALTTEIAACERIESELKAKAKKEAGERLAKEAAEQVAQKGGKSLVRRGTGFVFRKTPLGLVFFAYDTCNGGVGHAVNEAIWPLSELWKD